jgi:hypothetical protein
LRYLRRFEGESAYVVLQEREKFKKAYKSRIYATMRVLSKAAARTREMRITIVQPKAKWKTVWKTLNETPVSEESKTTWFRVIHDILPAMGPLKNQAVPHGRLRRLRKDGDN